jgi:asparagine synthase (glutamine-hydrolysing)
MRSDVPLGALLSGGVDSSLVAALMAELSPHPVEAFSIGYGAEGAYMNEIPWARRVAERWGMKHHPLVVEPEDLVRDFERVTWHLDEPVGDPAAFLTLALSEFSRRHVTVVLSGLGADELFAGYRRYRALGLAERFRALPAWLRDGIVRPLVEWLPEARTRRLGDYARLAKKFLRSLDPDPRRAWASTVSYLPAYAGPLFTDELAPLRRETYGCAAFDEIWKRAADFPDPVDRAEYVDLHMYMVDQLLLLQDKMSMAVSLEARVPYLDHRLVELAASIPSAAKLAGGEQKAVLKKVAEKYVPRECIYREKKGFAAPVEAWLRGPLRERVNDALSPARVRARGLFRVEFVEWMKREFYASARDLSLQLYQALLLETWFSLFVDGAGRPSSAPIRR